MYIYFSGSLHILFKVNNLHSFFGNDLLEPAYMLFGGCLEIMSKLLKPQQTILKRPEIMVRQHLHFLPRHVLVNKLCSAPYIFLAIVDVFDKGNADDRLNPRSANAPDIVENNAVFHSRKPLMFKAVHMLNVSKYKVQLCHYICHLFPIEKAGSLYRLGNAEA